MINKSNDEGFAEVVISANTPPPLITLFRNDTHNRVELHLRGEFGSPQECTAEIAELGQLSTQYSTILVYISSIGGRIDLLMEIMGMLEKFNTIITATLSDANSAGFMLWARGDVRVVAPTAEMMIHRETSGYINKTDLVLERYEFVKRRFERIFVEFCGHILTQEEMDRARISEVWLLGQDLIDRQKAISWEQFHSNDTLPREVMEIVEVRGQRYVVQDGEFLVPVDVVFSSDAVYSVFDVVYDLPETISLINDSQDATDEDDEDDDDEENDDAKQLEAKTFIEDDFPDWWTTIHFGTYNIISSERVDVLRDIMRSVFGKGKYAYSPYSSCDLLTYIEDGSRYTMFEESFTLSDLIMAILTLLDDPYSDRMSEWLTDHL